MTDLTIAFAAAAIIALVATVAVHLWAPGHRQLPRLAVVDGALLLAYTGLLWFRMGTMV